MTRPVETKSYYIGDQIGSARLEIAGEGWPLAAEAYYSFGQELAPPIR